VYRDQKRWADAQRMFERALTIRQRALPKGHRLILESMHSLELTAEDRGDLAAAARWKAAQADTLAR
jgi:hypothetical protein